MNLVEEVALAAGDPLPASVYESDEPIILRGYVDHWPAVQMAKESNAHLADYLSNFDAKRQLTVYAGDAQMRGRFFYNDSFSGFNFRSGRATLDQVLGRLLGPPVDDDIEFLYVGSTPVDQWLPGFRQGNDIELPVADALMNFWMGGRTTISAHFDFPDNIACVVAGSRHFTLFPPEQLENLYIGPLDRTPAGQAISLVDFANPDLTRFPNFPKAMAQAVHADLSVGDALFIPSMWWHHVVSNDNFNLLVNYWWCMAPVHMGGPSAVLNHAIVALRSLPPRQKAAWKRMFDHYVFDVDDHVVDHIPVQGRGLLGELDQATVTRVKTELVDRLK